jgi:hypothetical protein
MVFGSWLGTAFLMLVHCAFAFTFAIGYRTRFCSIVIWIFHNSLLARNLPVGHGGDMYFRCLLFWSMFLPLGEVWSVDAALRPGSHSQPPRRSYSILSAATICYIVQVGYMYVFSHYLKTHDWWRKDFTAAYYAVRLDYFRLPLGDFFLAFPWMLTVLTPAVLIWELVGPFFYISPVATQPLRLFGVIGFIALHLGFGLSLRLGTFFWISACAQTALIPPFVWEIVMKLVTTRARLGLRVRYPSHCSICSAAARIFQTMFLIPQTDIQPTHTHADDPETKAYANGSSHPAMPYSSSDTLVLILTLSLSLSLFLSISISIYPFRLAIG